MWKKSLCNMTESEGRGRRLETRLILDCTVERYAKIYAENTIVNRDTFAGMMA